MSQRYSSFRNLISGDPGNIRMSFISTRNEGADGSGLLEAPRPCASEQVVAQVVFGGCGFHEAARGPEWPILWVQGDASAGTRLEGVQTFTLEGQALRRISIGDRVVGSAWCDKDADYCLLAGVVPRDISAGRGDQTRGCLEQLESALAKAGMDFTHVVRTWFFLEDLLAWYDEFNASRTAFFRGRGIFEHLIPASTGIGGSNPAGSALAAGALAIRPRHAAVGIHEVESPMQRPATEYRSSFSRAVEVAFPDRRLLLISGTASIAPDGKSLHAGNVARQIDLTLDVVHAILASRGMDWQNATRGAAYFRDIGAVPIFEQRCRERGIQPLPLLYSHAVVCRDDLLFELELDAVVQPAIVADSRDAKERQESPR